MPPSPPPLDVRLAGIFQAEATEHVQRMLAGVAQLEAGAADAAAARAVESLFRAAHSLKGAARAVGRAEIEAVCHAMESQLANLQRNPQAWTAALGDALHDTAVGLQATLAGGAPDAPRLAALLQRLQAPDGGSAAPPQHAARPRPSVAPAPPAAEPAPPPPETDETVRIGIDRLAALLHDVEELVALKLTGRQLVEDVDSVLAFSQGLRPQARRDASALQGHESLERRLHALRVAALREQRQLASAVDGLLAGTKSVLLLPVRSLTPYLTAAVRELSRSQHKEIELRLEGDEVEMDRRLLQALREPLVHLLRNAVFHGIEDAAARQAAGKPAKGRLALVIAPRAGGRVVLTVRDDGAGIDTERLAAAARRLQLPLPEDATRENLLQLVFSDGLSTAAGLTQVAGRGVGLAIVRQTVERMAGTVSVHSIPGEGTAFTMTLPLSLATFRAIEVRAGGRSLLVPTAQVERCIRLGAHEQRMLAAQPVLRWGDRDLPLASLSALLELPATEAAVDRPSCLVLHSAGHAVALAVDEVVGELEVLSKPVDAGLTATPLIAGAAVLGDGRTVVILNGAELVRAALRPGRGGALTLGPAAVPAHARTILLAEDSITSRTLLKNILEVAGYRVEVAADGAQALHKLRAGPFDLVVSDVEMPNLDGIGLTRAIRAEPRFAQLPVVLVTSLASPADRERGAEAGADAYIIKSGFDQADLIQTIAELL